MTRIQSHKGRPFVNAKYGISNVVRRQRPPNGEVSKVVDYAYHELSAEDRRLIDMQTDRLIVGIRHSLGVAGAHELLYRIGQYLNNNPGVIDKIMDKPDAT